MQFQTSIHSLKKFWDLNEGLKINLWSYPETDSKPGQTSKLELWGFEDPAQ